MSKQNPVARMRERVLADLEQRKKRMIPDDLVEEAEAETHPLHNDFEWDNTIAGHQFRLEQARAIIRSVRITTVYEDQIIIVPKYVSDPRPEREDPSAYVRLHALKRRSEDAKRVMMDEIARIEGAITRARAVSSVLGLRDDLDAIVAALAEVRRKMDDAA